MRLTSEYYQTNELELKEIRDLRASLDKFKARMDKLKADLDIYRNEIRECKKQIEIALTESRRAK